MSGCQETGRLTANIGYCHSPAFPLVRRATWRRRVHSAPASSELQPGCGSIADRIIAVLSEPITIGAHEVSVGVSIGIAFGSPGVKSVADAIREADTAMYYAKTSGRGQFRIFTPEMQTKRLCAFNSNQTCDRP